MAAPVTVGNGPAIDAARDPQNDATADVEFDTTTATAVFGASTATGGFGSTTAAAVFDTTIVIVVFDTESVTGERIRHMPARPLD